MEWLNRQIKQAFKNRRWGLLFVYIILAAIIFLVYAITVDRFAGWANRQLDERSAEMLNFLFRFLSWDLFPIIGWLLLFILAVIGFVILYIRAGKQAPKTEGGIQPKSYDKRDAIISNEQPLEPLELIDSFPKDNEAITTEDVKKIFLKFNKPIDGKTVGYISNYYIRRNSRCQWNICGWIQFSENDTKLIWHVHERLLQNKDEYGPIDIDYPTFEIRIGLPTEDWKLKATDGSKLPETIIRVKIKPE